MLMLSLACSGTPADVEDAPAEQTSVTILSGRDEQFALDLLDLVAERHPELELVTDFGKDSNYLDRIDAWGDAPKADLFLSKSSGTMETLSASGHAAPLDAALLERVPARYRSDDWIGLSVRARVLVTRDDVEDPPSAVMDLADPKWEGRVARTVATNGSFVGGVSTLVAEHGEDDTRAFLEALKRNSEGNVHPKHTPAVAAVAAGDADVALVNHYYFYRSEADDLVVVYPDPVAWNVTGGAILRGAPNPEGARKVLEVLLSDEGQAAYAHSNNEYGAVEGVAPPAGVTPPGKFAWSTTSLSALSEAQPTAVRLIQEVGLE